MAPARPWRLAVVAGTIALTLTACGPTDSEIATGSGAPAAAPGGDTAPAIPAVPEPATTPTVDAPAGHVPPALWETTELDPSTVLLSAGSDYFTSKAYLPEGTVLQTHSQDGEVTSSITLDGDVCGAVAVGGVEDGLVLTGAHVTTPAEGINPATERHAIVAYHPDSWDVAWATDLPDATADEDCYGLAAQSVSPGGEWVALTATRWSARTIAVADGTLSEEFSTLAGHDTLPWVGDYVAYPTEESGTTDWRVVDPATGALQYLIPDGRPAQGVVTVGDTAVMNTADGSVGIDVATGEEVWQWPTRLLESNHTPLAADPYLVAPLWRDGVEGVTTLTLDGDTPRELHHLPTALELCGASGNHIVATTADQVVVLDATTGEQVGYTTLPTPGCGLGLVGDHLITGSGVTRVLE